MGTLNDILEAQSKPIATSTPIQDKVTRDPSRLTEMTPPPQSIFPSYEEDRRSKKPKTTPVTARATQDQTKVPTDSVGDKNDKKEKPTDKTAVLTPHDHGKKINKPSSSTKKKRQKITSHGNLKKRPET